MQLIARILFLVMAIWLSGCYSFTGVSINPEVKTYFVSNFKSNAINAIPGIAPDFTEALKEKIRTQSRLILDDVSPDVEFLGTIVNYQISSEAPQPGEIVALNRLTIVLAIEFVDHKDEENNWKSNFSHFVNFSSDVDIASVQEDLVLEISDQLMEDIFNKAFTDW